jgi:RNA polymerase sigma-70 factor (ECF subfamily)
LALCFVRANAPSEILRAERAEGALGTGLSTLEVGRVVALRVAIDRVAEDTVVEALARRDPRRAADALWRAYGGEVFGWLVAVYGASEASEVAGALGLSVVRGIEGFRGESTARTWLYQLARTEVRQHRRATRRRRQVMTPLSHHPSAGERADVAPSRSAALDLDRLRAHLSEEERSLLVLRYDRELTYEEIAAVLLDDVEPARGAARLRQRVRDVKGKLASLAR